MDSCVPLQGRNFQQNSEERVPSSMENLSGNRDVNSPPNSKHGGKKRYNRKRKCRSRVSVEGDSFHTDSFRPSAFWQNYQKAFQWGNNQETAYWRSKAVALELENRMLRHRIARLSIDDKGSVPPSTSLPVKGHDSLFSQEASRPNVNVSRKRRRKKKSKRRKHSDVQENDVSDSQFEFEVTEEMKDFFEQHMVHKMEQEKKHLEDKKKSEEAANAAGEENAKLISQPINFSARADELKILYGDALPMIHGMETAIQLTFRRHCEKTGARLWPNIPLRF